MTRARTLLVAMIASTAFAINCKFDASGLSSIHEAGARFEGCFASTSGGGLKTILDHHGSDLLVGALYLGQGNQQQVYVIDGLALSDTKAEVSGVPAGGSGTATKITLELLIASQQDDDKLTVTIGSQPPSVQLDRCASIL